MSDTRFLRGFALLSAISAIPLTIAACTPFGEQPTGGPEVEDAGSIEGDVRMSEPLRDGGLEGSAAKPDAERGRGGCPGGESCERVVFVTSASFTADVGGIAGADKKCTAMAVLSSHERVRNREFVAWLSDDATSPLTRMVRSTAPYVRPDGTTIAQSFAALTSGAPLDEPISLDENGDDATPSSVWTGTGPTGAAVGGNCAGWTGGGTLGNKGQVGTRSRWTGTGPPLGLVGACTADVGRLYCFEK